MRSKAGTDFKTEDVGLQRVLDRAREDRTRLRVTYDGPYGRMANNHDFGYIGRSMGNPNYPDGGTKSPIILHNSRSDGGDILPDEHIIKVQLSRGGYVLWETKGSDLE